MQPIKAMPTSCNALVKVSYIKKMQPIKALWKVL